MARSISFRVNDITSGSKIIQLPDDYIRDIKNCKVREVWADFMLPGSTKETKSLKKQVKEWAESVLALVKRFKLGESLEMSFSISQYRIVDIVGGYLMFDDYFIEVFESEPFLTKDNDRLLPVSSFTDRTEAEIKKVESHFCSLLKSFIV